MNFTEGILDTPELLFGWVDYALFLMLLALSMLIGVYFGYWGKKEDTPTEYLHGGKTMSTFPVAVSIVVSYISGITVMGIPAEIYRFGSVYSLSVISSVAMPIITTYFYLPVLFDLQLTSTYEYFELRYNHNVRVLGSVLFTIDLLLVTPIMIYVPAMAFNQVSGINLHYITVGISIVCIFYTMIGGIKAVVWADFLQGGLMIVSNIIIVILGVTNSGGIADILRTNNEGGRLNFFEMNPSPFIRLSSWSIVIGHTLTYVCFIGMYQTTVQRFICLPTLSHAKRSMILCGLGLALINTIGIITGLIIYAAYHDCDPIESKAIKKPDQLVIYYITDIAGSIPGLSGLFVAGIFSAAISSMSSMLNSIGATVFEDFIRPCMKRSLTDETINKIIKCIVFAVGVVCVLLVFVVDQFQSLLQLALTMDGIIGGPMLGLFTFGMFYPRGNAKGALAGSICSVLTVGWIAFGAQIAIIDGSYKQAYLPTSVEGCNFNVTLSDPPVDEEPQAEPFILYQLSFTYYTLLGLIIMVVVGVIVSHFTEPPEFDKINPRLFTPLVKKYVIKRQVELKRGALRMELLNTVKT